MGCEVFGTRKRTQGVECFFIMSYYNTNHTTIDMNTQESIGGSTTTSVEDVATVSGTLTDTSNSLSTNTHPDDQFTELTSVTRTVNNEQTYVSTSIDTQTDPITVITAMKSTPNQEPDTTIQQSSAAADLTTETTTEQALDVTTQRTTTEIPVPDPGCSDDKKRKKRELCDD